MTTKLNKGDIKRLLFPKGNHKYEHGLRYDVSYQFAIRSWHSIYCVFIWNDFIEQEGGLWKIDDYMTPWILNIKFNFLSRGIMFPNIPQYYPDLFTSF